ncbi:hypothetical protein jhhlp_003996 [Lomentospora prolificans]|uniref:Uncharacterized protein n=1 Tax=Lomentospora prolificans TaxID=41688 RepID=A0A2N3NAD7_9PEZI|nr:hypothetical protein jhhlp_003996 [Lomentospora prolificans]
MPASTQTVAPASASKSKKFELPALEFKFGSLTEGTDIPPPLPSPVQEVPTPPRTPAADADKENKESSAVSVNGSGVEGSSKAQKDKINGTIITAGTKRPADDTPLSPALSSRQGSIRRLFSRTLLNNTYEEGEAHANGNGVANGGVRPGSRSASILDEKKAKRSSGWFRRLRSGGAPEASAKRSSVLYQEAAKPSGPPPPMIPELSALSTKLDLGDSSGLGGDDLFKNIK